MALKKERKSEETKIETPRFCFTIMPFGGWFDDYYSKIYSPAIKNAGFESKRADDLYRPGTIINDIWTFTKDCSIVLADLTGKNPNVLYELGLAHAIAKPVILITEDISDIPFDLRALRVIEYNKNISNWGEVLQTKITKAMEEVVSSPLKSVLPAFLDVDDSKRTRSVTKQDKEIIELTQDIDALRRELRAVSQKSLRGDNARPEPEVAKNMLEQLFNENPSVSVSEIISFSEKRNIPTQWALEAFQNIKQDWEDSIPF